MIQRREDDTLAVGRWACAAQLPHRKHAVIHRVFELHQIANQLIHLGAERELRLLARGNIQAPDLPVMCRHDGLRVGRPRVTRQQVARATRLDVVALIVVRKPAFVAACQVTQLESCRRHLARCVCEMLAVGRNRVPERRAEIQGARRETAGGPNIHHHLGSAGHLVVASLKVASGRRRFQLSSVRSVTAVVVALQNARIPGTMEDS